MIVGPYEQHCEGKPSPHPTDRGNDVNNTIYISVGINNKRKAI